MKALRAIRDLAVGILGGVIGVVLLFFFWLIHAAVTAVRDLWRAFSSAT